MPLTPAPIVWPRLPLATAHCALFVTGPKAAIPDAVGGEEIRRVTGEVGIFKLAPNSSLVPHTGNSNVRLTAHLGLLVLEGCWLFVDQDTHSWREGELVVFDDAFVHSVENRHPERDRYVLLLNFWKPGSAATSATTALCEMLDCCASVTVLFCSNADARTSCLQSLYVGSFIDLPHYPRQGHAKQTSHTPPDALRLFQDHAPQPGDASVGSVITE